MKGRQDRLKSRIYVGGPAAAGLTSIAHPRSVEQNKSHDRDVELTVQVIEQKPPIFPAALKPGDLIEIVAPAKYLDKERVTLVEAPFLIVEGVLQNEDGVCSIRAERVLRLDGFSPEASIESHDFH